MTAKKQLTTALQAAQQCGVNKGVQLQAFMKGVAYARKHGDWRSVKDELPNGDDYVLTYNYENCDLSVAEYTKTYGWVDNKYNFIATPDIWMPLPETPKTEE